MTTEEILRQRSNNTCELCENTESLQAHDVPPGTGEIDKSILICKTCFEQLQGAQPLDANHWRCLNTSMWSTMPAVQVTAWRLLTRLAGQGEAWPQDLLDMLYLDDETLAWAKSGVSSEEAVAEERMVHKDSNGTILAAGDTVVLIKDLDVKGGGFTAKRGTAVKGIVLVEDNAGQIEGRVNGQQIVILTQYVKKSV
jgi:protein PhnA